MKYSSLYLSMFLNGAPPSNGNVGSGLLPLNTFWGHEESVFTSISIPSIRKKLATGTVPFVLAVSSVDTTATGVRPNTGKPVNPLLDLDTRWTLTFSDGTPIEFKNDVYIKDPDGVQINPYTDQFGPEARFLIREPGTYTLTQISKGPNGAGGYITQTFSETITVAEENTVTHRWIDGGNGLDTNDGLDPNGFNLVNAVYDDVNKTITKVGAFTAFSLDTEYPQFSANYIYLTGGTGINTGLYRIVDKLNNDTIVIDKSAGVSATDVSSSNGPVKTWDDGSGTGNLAVLNEYTHLRGGQTYQITKEYKVNDGLSLGKMAVIGYGGKPTLLGMPSSLTTSIINISNSGVNENANKVYIGNIYIDGNGNRDTLGGYTASNSTTTREIIIDNVDMAHSKGEGGLGYQTKNSNCFPVIFMLWNVSVDNTRFRETVVQAAQTGQSVLNTTVTTGLAFTGWSGTGSPDVTLDYTADPGILDHVEIDDEIYITGSTANTTWVVTAPPVNNTVAVTRRDGSDAYNAASGVSLTVYTASILTQQPIPLSCEPNGSIEFIDIDNKINVVKYHKFSGNKIFVDVDGYSYNRLGLANFNVGDDITLAENKRMGIYTYIGDQDGYVGAVGLQIKSDGDHIILDHYWYENGQHDHSCINCIHILDGKNVSYALNLNVERDYNGNPFHRLITTITNFNFNDTDYGIDGSNGSNNPALGVFDNIYAVRGRANLYNSLMYYFCTVHSRLTGVNFTSKSPNSSMVWSLGTSTDETVSTDWDTVVSRVNAYDASLIADNSQVDYEVFNNNIMNTDVSAYGAKVYKNTFADTLRYFANNNMYLPNNTSSTPFVLDSTNVNLLDLNIGTDGGNTNQAPDWVNPAVTDFNVNAQPLVLNNLVLPDAEQNKFYSFSLSSIIASGTLATNWSIVSGTLPTGLSLNSRSGDITGIPTVSDVTSNLVFRATNAAGSADTNQASLYVSAPINFITFDGTNYADITPITGLTTGDTITIEFIRTGNNLYLFSGGLSSPSTNVDINFNYNRIGFTGGTLTIDGIPITSGAVNTDFMDGKWHTAVLTINDNNGREISTVARNNVNGSDNNYYTSSLRNLSIVKGGVETKYAMDSGSTTTEDAVVGTGTMTYVNVTPANWDF